MVGIEHPRWQKNLERMQKANVQIARAKKAGGVGGFFGNIAGSAKAALAFVSLYTIPAIKHDVPQETLMKPAY